MLIFSLPQVDLWTETLASEEYGALAMLVAKGVTTEVETTEALTDSTAGSSGTEGGGKDTEGRADLVDGKPLRVTR